GVQRGRGQGQAGAGKGRKHGVNAKPVRQDYGSYGSGTTRRTLTSRAFSQCVNTRILRSQGPENTRMPGGTRHRTDGSSNGKASCTSGKIRSANMARSGTSKPAGPRGRHSPTQKVRRGGEMTAGDLTAAKAKVSMVKATEPSDLVFFFSALSTLHFLIAYMLSRHRQRTEADVTKDISGLQGRSARGKVRDVLETAWVSPITMFILTSMSITQLKFLLVHASQPIRRDEDAVQLSGRWTVNDSGPNGTR
ncbi:hypothetical protein CF327_g7718, partial [Tilletia walkeri]